MATYREAFNLARRLLKDPNAEKIKEGTLMPFLQESLRKCQRSLGDNGMQILRGLQTLTLPAGAVQLTLTSVPALASDFVLPWEIQELDGGTSGRYQDMTKDEGFLPDIPQQQRLRVWNWRGSALLFVGATRDVQIRISYEKELAVPSLMTDQIPIIGGVSAIAYYAAFLFSGESSHVGLYEDAISSLVNQEVRANQYKPVRRIPYRYR